MLLIHELDEHQQVNKCVTIVESEQDTEFSYTLGQRVDWILEVRERIIGPAT
jgi:hypothetical protein